MTHILAIIPARYASTRFPGKPLALIEGKPMIQWVWEGVARINAIEQSIVATDDERIAHVVENFGGRVMMTGSNHRSGTDRCGEVLQRMGAEAEKFDVIINIQGDEPKVEHTQIELLASCFNNDSVQIATLKKRIESHADLFSPNVVKVIDNPQGNALYFSRQPLPHLRGVEPSEWTEKFAYFKHIGIYAFRRTTLQQVVTLPQSPLELCESLEQLRWIENGYSIAVRETHVENVSVDTPEDLKKLEK